jgi:hypothetical protein
MKYLAFAMIALFGLIAATPDANAVVCARGVCRASCAGPHGAVVVRHRYCYWLGPAGGHPAAQAGGEGALCCKKAWITTGCDLH